MASPKTLPCQLHFTLLFDPGMNTVLRFSPKEQNVQKTLTLTLKRPQGPGALMTVVALTVDLPEFRITMETHPGCVCEGIREGFMEVGRAP